MTNVEELVNAYLQWLKENITVSELGDWFEITTPFLDRHNDHLQIYIKADGNELVLTDDGYTVNDLAMTGCDVSTPRRRELLETTLAGFGVQLQDQVLTARATRQTFAQKKHTLLQAMLAVNDLFMTNRPTVRGLFAEDVEQFLISHQVRFVPAVQMTGKSGLAHRFDYVIPRWRDTPERVVETINNPTRDRVTSMLFAWNDVREMRRHPMAMYAIMNDTERRISRQLVNACTGYGVRVVPWSGRDEAVELLLA